MSSTFFKMEGYGLQGPTDLGIIRYIPSLEPLCHFIDLVLRAEDYEVDITAVSLNDDDKAQLGFDLTHDVINETLVSKFYEQLGKKGQKELLDAISTIADEFRHFRFYSYMDDSCSADKLGGADAEQIYIDMFSIHKAIKGGCDPVEALSKFVLGYVYEWHGENVYQLFNETMAYFEKNLLSKILSITLHHENMVTFPRYRITIEAEEQNGKS